MFARQQRFSFRKGYPRRSFSSHYFVLRYDTNELSLKCAVVVGKKVDKRAVARNKIKRRTVSLLQGLLPKELPYSIVLIARKPIVEASSEQIKQELEETFRKTNIL